MFRKERVNSLVITGERINEIYEDTLLRDSDFDEEGLKDDYLVGEGLNKVSYFSATRMGQYMEELDGYISSLKNIDTAPSLSELAHLEDDSMWTESVEDLDTLLQVGIAAGMLFMPLPKDTWKLLPGGLPFVGRTLYSVDQKRYGHSGKTFVR